MISTKKPAGLGKKFCLYVFTDNSQLDLVPPRRRRGDLALVESLVPRRDGPDPQLPEVRERDVVRGEALVRRVGVPAVLPVQSPPTLSSTF